MRSPRTGALPTDLSALIDRLSDYERRLRTLEAPSGEALGSTVEKLTALVADIQEQLDAWVAGRYTNAQIDTNIANGDSAVVAQIQPAIDAKFAGSPTVGGNLGVSGSATVGGPFYAPNAVGFNITTTRRTLWIEDATGRLGYATSTEREKVGVHAADEDRLLAILDVAPVTWWYREEVRRRTALRINSGVDYTPPRELGLIAEELDAAGFREFVLYNPEDGTPEGVEYSMIVVALIGAGRRLRDEVASLRADVADIRAALDG